MNLKIKKGIALLLCLAMMIPAGAASVFSDDEPTDEETSSSEEEQEEKEEKSSKKKKKDKTPPPTDEEAYAKLKVVAQNANLEFSYNKKDNTFCIYDKRSNHYWWSNPIDVAQSNAKPAQRQELSSGQTMIYGEPATRATTTMVNKSKGKFEAKEIANGVQVNYIYDDPGIVIPVQYTLEDEYLKVYVNTSEIEEKYPSSVDGKLVTDIAFSTTFGCAGLNDTGYFVIPDGSGSIIEFNNGKTNLKTYTGKVYGRDITQVKVIKQAVTKKVNLPMYGIVKQSTKDAQGNEKAVNAGLMVVADKGDTCATINSYVSNQNKNDYNTTYFDFEVRTSDEYMMGGESNPLKVFEKYGILVPEIEIRYYPVAGDGKIDYVDIADCYRNYLIKEKGVVDKDLTDTYSLFVDLYGGTLKTESIMGLPVTVKESVTTFAAAKNILSGLHDNGVDDMVVTYNKFYNNDIGEKITDSYSPSSKLGGNGKFKSLKSYAEGNNIKLYPSADNLLYKSGNGYWNMTNTAMRVSNAMAQISEFNLAHGTVNEYYKPLSLFSPGSYDKAFSKLIKSDAKKGVTNYAFGSLSNTIYGDYSRRKKISREGAKGIIQDIYANAKSNGSVLMEYPAAYVLPYADYITNVPVCSSKFDLFDDDIPFYQMVMHGITPYGGCAVNSDANTAEMILSEIAAGSNLSFDFVGVDVSELKDTKLDCYYYAYYGSWSEEAAGLYRMANEILAPVSDATITSYVINNDNKTIETGYSNGMTTVVDLNNKTVTANGTVYKLSDYIGQEVLGK